MSKLVVDEDPPKNNSNNQSQPFDLSGLAPPPNLPIAGQDKWFYQDPQVTVNVRLNPSLTKILFFRVKCKVPSPIWKCLSGSKPAISDRT